MPEDEQIIAEIQTKVNAAMRKRMGDIMRIKEEPDQAKKDIQTTQLVRIVSREIEADVNVVEVFVEPWLQ